MWIIQSLLKRHWLQWDLNCEPPAYSKVSNKWKSDKGLLLNCFFLSFSNHKNYSIKNICVYSKSKGNLERFKMINRRLFMHKFCNNSKYVAVILLGNIYWRDCVFVFNLPDRIGRIAGSGVFLPDGTFSPRANFSSFEYLCFSILLLFRFILI